MTISTGLPVGYAIERVDLATANDDLMRQVVALEHVMHAESHAEDPPYPDAIIEARFRVSSKLWERSQWAAFADGRLIGRITAMQNKSGSNEHIREIDLSVHPEHRRRGIGRALFAAALDAIPDADAKLVEGWTSSRVPDGIAFAERLGAKKGLHMRSSQLDLQAVDRDLMNEWAALDPKGYRLEWVLGDIPDPLLATAIEAFNAINRMPREDLEMEDWVFNEATTRDWERMRKARGQEQWLILAVQDATNAGAGFTNVVFDKRYPHVIHQGGTAVDHGHQGHGLGKWVKARMVEKLIREMPQARYIRTENAGTNAPMLSINHRMGFALAWENDIWQLPLADAKAYARR